MPTVGKLMHESSLKAKVQQCRQPESGRLTRRKKMVNNLKEADQRIVDVALAGHIKERERKRGNNNNLYIIGEEDRENVEEALDG